VPACGRAIDAGTCPPHSHQCATIFIPLPCRVTPYLANLGWTSDGQAVSYDITLPADIPAVRLCALQASYFAARLLLEQAAGNLGTFTGSLGRRSQISLYTFGGPRVGDATFAG
jgi:hypothetical protein